MENISMQAYALFNNGVFSTIMYYPSTGDDQMIRITAALQSSPKIILDSENTVDSVNKYDIFVGEDYAGYLFILKEDPRYDLSSLHNALKNNPTVVWIESETLPKQDDVYSYNNNILELVEK